MNPCLLCLLAATLIPQSQLRDREFEITEQRTEYLRESLQELQRITAWLEDLGDPAIKEPNESTDAYFERVEGFFRHRAQLLILLHWEYEEALETRYSLEADLKEYTYRINNAQKDSDRRFEDLKNRKDELQAETEVGRIEGIVATDVLRRALETEEKELSEKADKTPQGEEQLATIRGEIGELAFVKQAIALVADRQTREDRYTGMTAAQLRQAVETLRKKVVDSSFESRYLETHVLVESPKLLEQILGEDRSALIKAANDLLGQSREIEDRAAQVAIMAKYVREDLNTIADMVGLVELRVALQQILDDEKIRAPVLEKIVGKQSGRLLGSDLEEAFVTSAASPPKEPSSN